MIDKKKFRRFYKTAVLVLLIFLVLCLLKFSYSIFHSDANGNVANKIAFYIVDAKSQTQTIKVGEVSPDGQDYEYKIDISNFKNGKTSEVDMQYTMNIRTTTNIPVDYELYFGNDTTNIIGTKDVVRDTNDMYFFNFSSHAGNFVHGVAKTDTFTFVVNFPTLYNDAAYQDLIETIEITIDVKQV